MDEEKLDKVKLIVARLMRHVQECRLHKNRTLLINCVHAIMPEASMESITRAQRKLWETALEQLEKGNKDYAFNYLPQEQQDFEDWCKIRKLDAEVYRQYYQRQQP